MSGHNRPVHYVITAVLTVFITTLVIGLTEAHCLPVSIVVDDVRNMPKGKLAFTTVSMGVCVMTFTPESVKRQDVMAHEKCHCLNDFDVLGPYGFDGISRDEEQQRENRAKECARKER